jgi:predicted ABC-class ATPase
LPADLADGRLRRIGAEDCLAREAGELLERRLKGPGADAVRPERCGPAVVERSACRITDTDVQLRLFVDLPAHRRRIRGLQAGRLVFDTLLPLAKSTLLFSARRVERARETAEAIEDHAAMQEELGRRGLVAFVAEGSLLARAGGDDSGPRRDGREVAFQPPDELRVRISLPHAGDVEGLGIPAGVTLIVGGGFHGKSTLLDAISMGVYPHHPGDGRELVATIPEAVQVRAEDGRSVRCADISAFLGELPSGVRSSSFTTEKASGSTSQASSIVEALEVGARLLLLDEDRCATNFMVRDGRMQRLVPRPAEPIVPFLDRVRDLYEQYGVSTVLVTGGSGDYLEVADTVIQMESYLPRDATEDARRIAEQTSSMRLREEIGPLKRPAEREPLSGGVPEPAGLRTGMRGPYGVRLGQETLDLRALEQIAESGQVRTIARLMKMAAQRMGKGKRLVQLIEELDDWLDREGIDGLDRPVAYDLSRPRPFELAAALNRWRALRFEPSASEES